MKKRILGFFRPKSIYMFLSLCALFFLFPSCDDDNGRGGGKQGFLSLTVSSETQYKPVSRADYTDPEDAGEYMIYILQGEEIVESFPYAEAPDELPLETGTYQVKATWGEHVPAAFEALYMEGVESFSVKENEVTSVTVTAAPANAAVIINYDDELAEVYPAGYYVEMSTQYTTEPFLYEQEENRPAYFMAGTDEKMNLEMFFSTEKNDYVFNGSFLFNPCDSVVVKVRLQDEEEIEEKPTLSVSPTFYQFTAESTQSINIRVTTNCDDFTYSSTGSWYTVVKETGTLRVTPQRNTGSSARAGYITITAMKGNKTISAEVSLVQLNTQTGETEKPYIFANPNTLKGNQFLDEEITIRTNSSSWAYEFVDEQPDWLSVSKNSNTLLVTTSEINKEEERSTKIAFSTTLNGSTARDTISITQTVTVDDPFIFPEINGQEVTKVSLLSAGETKLISINTNTSDWEVIIPDDASTWLSCIENKGNNTISLTAEPISSETSRITFITLKATAKNGQPASCIVTVEQGGLDRPKLVVTIEVNRETLGDPKELEGYEVGSPYEDSDRPVITLSGQFKILDTNGVYSINLKQGEARSEMIMLMVPKGIESCTLDETELFNTNTVGNVTCSTNSAETMGVIYMDNYLNSLVRDAVVQLKVKDKDGGEASVMLIITIE